MEWFVATGLTVRLVGTLRLQDAAGRDCTPRGAKARALIGLLALSPDKMRSRRWIEARLWSDRGPDQASGSLRQVLVELRDALGEARDALFTNRDQIGLRGLTSDLETDPEASRKAMEQGAELMEGLGLRDPAFAAWLGEQRARLAGRSLVQSLRPPEPEDRALPFVIRTGTLPSGFGGFLPLALAEAIGRLVTDFALVEVFSPNSAVVRIGPQDRGLEVTLEAAENAGQLYLMVSMIASGTGQALWSRQTVLPLSRADLVAAGEFPAIVFEAAETAMAALPKVVGNESAALRAEAMTARAVRDIFTFDAWRLRDADRLLQASLETAPTPRAFAWRGLLRQIMIIERTETNRAQIFDEAEQFARAAVERAPSNSLVLALASQVQVMVRENADAGAMLARDSVALGPNNAFGYAAQAGSYLRLGQADLALAAARNGVSLGRRSAFLPLMEAMAGLAAVALGDGEAAVQHFEAARARAPNFRSPLRHLLFLYLSTGQADRALRVLNDLRRVEPDFSLSMIREDPAYPAGTLRRTKLLTYSLP